MKVLKFGGTSVGSVENIKRVKEIVNDGSPKIVVLSAMSGTTNSLVSIYNAFSNGETAKAQEEIYTLKVKYTAVINQLISHAEMKISAQKYCSNIFAYLTDLLQKPVSVKIYNKMVAQGELLSTYLVTTYFKQEGVSVTLIPALDFMRIDKQNEPDTFYIKQNLNRFLQSSEKVEIFITQGFICLDATGEIANLQRGGSDYTATIIGSAIKAEEVEIWTDIDGMHNNDPRFVENTHAISDLSFDEAAELAYFGAKILHPQTVMPARENNIPVRLKNTLEPEAYGTLISGEVKGDGIKAIAAKDEITAIKIKSARMLLAHGFLKKVFEIFEKHQTSIDMITTSEIAVSLTIDSTLKLQEIIEELSSFATVEVDSNQSIICLVGNNVANHSNTYKLFEVLKDISVRMISYGGSNNNISLLVNTADKINTLKKLNQYVFSVN